MGALRVFDGFESISTIKNAIQTLQVPHFLKKNLLDSHKKLPFEHILGAVRVFDGAESISTIKNTIQTLQLPEFLNFFY